VDIRADARGNLSSLAEAAAGTGGVEEGLVESDRLDERRHRLEDPVHLRARLGVERVVAAQEERMRAEPLRADRRHRRVDPEHTRFVRRGRDHAALPRSADDHRLTGE
jgi:hypothetical protein